jgi:hypothetical protein
MDAIHRVDGDRVHVSPNAAGPWDGGMQHGSAPAALAVWAAESIPAKEAMRIARVTIDLMRPVPFAPLTLQTEVLREGRDGTAAALDFRAWTFSTRTGIHPRIKSEECFAGKRSGMIVRPLKP